MFGVRDAVGAQVIICVRITNYQHSSMDLVVDLVRHTFAVETAVPYADERALFADVACREIVNDTLRGLGLEAHGVV